MELSDEAQKGLLKIINYPPEVSSDHFVHDFNRSRTLKGSPSVPRFVPYIDGRRDLPTYASRAEILRKIEENPVTIISGATGSGKTTQVPQYILEQCSIQRKKCKIVCTQPRRLSTISVAERVGNEQNANLGDEVGYQVRLEDCTSAQTNLIFMTSGCLLQHFIGKKHDKIANKITHLIIDEVHERELRTDVLLCIAKEMVGQNSQLKVVLMSATMNVELFQRYFPSPAIINIPGQTFGVVISYLGDIISRTNYGAISNDDGTAVDHQLLTHLISYVHSNTAIDEAMLVFLPGMDDINTQSSNLFQLLGHNSHTQIILHSEVEKANLSVHREFNGLRKIILSTNIAETSITIADCVHVIDCGLQKLMTYDSISDCRHLELTRISRASATQRAGRVGRTREGQCYRLYSQQTFDSLEEFTTPEILRSPLTDVCLQIKSMTDGNIQEFLLRMIEPPAPHEIASNVNLLKAMELIDNQERITELGNIALALPVDVKYAKAIILSTALRCLESVVMVISMLSSPQPFKIPTNDNERTILGAAKARFAAGTISDFHLLWKLYDGYINRYEKMDFCNDNFLSFTSMRSAHSIFKMIKTRLQRLNYVHTTSSYAYGSANVNQRNWQLIHLCLAASLQQNVGVAAFDELGRPVIKSRLDEALVPHRTSVCRLQSIALDNFVIYDQKVLEGRDNYQLKVIAQVAPVNMLLVCTSSAAIFDLTNNTCTIGNTFEVSVDRQFFITLIEVRNWLNTLFDRFQRLPHTTMTHEEGRRMSLILDEILQN